MCRIRGVIHWNHWGLRSQHLYSTSVECVEWGWAATQLLERAWGLWVKGSAYPVGMSVPAKNVELPMPWRECPFDGKKWYKALMTVEQKESDSLSQALLFEKLFNSTVNRLHCLENIDTGLRIIIQLARKTDEVNHSAPNMSLEYVIKNLVVLGDSSGEVRGTDLRDIPVKAILSAYAQHDAENTIAFNRVALLDFPESRGIPKKYWDEDVDGQMDTVYPPTHILDPLPTQYSKRPWFYALVAEQYDALAREHPDANIANLMIALNPDVAAGSVRRWITRARKEGLLPPADWKRGQ